MIKYSSLQKIGLNPLTVEKITSGLAHLTGAGVGAYAGNRLSNFSADTLGLDPKERALSVGVATGGGALTGLSLTHTLSKLFTPKMKQKIIEELAKLKATEPKDLSAIHEAEKSLKGYEPTDIAGKFKRDAVTLVGTDLGATGAVGGIHKEFRNLDDADKVLKDQGHQSTLSRFPGGAAGAVAAGGLSAAGISALMNLSAAAKRVSEGKTIRLSTSLRKRPGHSTDINLGIQSFNQSPKTLGPGQTHLPEQAENEEDY